MPWQRTTTAGFDEQGHGSHEVIGYSGLQTALLAVTNRALFEAWIRASDLAGAGFGLAGYDAPTSANVWGCVRQLCTGRGTGCGLYFREHGGGGGLVAGAAPHRPALSRLSVKMELMETDIAKQPVPECTG